MIYLYNCAIDFKGVIQPLVIDPVDFCLNVVRTGQGLVGNDLEVLGSQILQRLGVGGKCFSLCQLEIEDLNIQLPLGADLGVELAQRSGGGIAGIGSLKSASNLNGNLNCSKELEHYAS